jgi:hypothetical protein
MLYDGQAEASMHHVDRPSYHGTWELRVSGTLS